DPAHRRRARERRRGRGADQSRRRCADPRENLHRQGGEQVRRVDRGGARLVRCEGAMAGRTAGRSEEHTSELQSREKLVCRFLPETAAPAISTLPLHAALPISIQRIAAARGSVAVAAVRINPDVDALTHAKISTGKAENKFGVSIAEARGWFDAKAQWPDVRLEDRKSTRLNSSHVKNSYAVFSLKRPRRRSPLFPSTPLFRSRSSASPPRAGASPWPRCGSIPTSMR